VNISAHARRGFTTLLYKHDVVNRNLRRVLPRVIQVYPRFEMWAESTGRASSL